ncbi:MAG TPA: hypothetical protein VK926_04545, partial [Gaiellaceae bacterium]|nr:hypothetical protein [Gaiellaceae bacterium]
AGMPPGKARDELLERMRRIHWSEPDPLAVIRDLESRGLPADLGAAAVLLSNRDPERFDGLYGRLSPELRGRMERLSPIRVAHGIDARVELASGPRDKYFPPAESRGLVAAVPDGRLTLTRLLDHAGPRIWRFDPAGIARFYGFLVRSLDVAAPDDERISRPGRRR